jgi:hypothetical protein
MSRKTKKERYLKAKIPFQRKRSGKKVQNATQVIVGDTTYKSKLEFRMASALEASNISFGYETLKAILVEGFEYLGKKVQPITYKPDFIVTDTTITYIIECKGYANDAWPIRSKLFKKYIADNNLNYKFIIVKNNQQIQETVNIILNDRLQFNTSDQP